MKFREIKVKKRTLIIFSLIFISLILLIFLFIYLYNNYSNFKTLNDFEKDSNEDTSEEEDITEEETELTEEINEEDSTVLENVTESSNTADSVSTSSNWWEYPDEILETNRSGNDLLVLVNKKYKLPSTYAPSDLVKASESGIRRGESYYVREILIDDLTDLVNDIEADGIDISIVSGYRSYTTQESTYQYWVNYNGGDTDEADKISARAGHSQHQLGTAIDFSTSSIGDVVGSSFTGTDAQLWLAKNAYKYGFVLSYPKGAEEKTGYSYESWHYRYIGKENALNFWNSGEVLDTWLAEQ